MSIIGACMVPHPPMIVPQVGRGSEHRIEETAKAYDQMAREVAALKPDTIVICTPHSVIYRDYFHISPGGYAAGSFAAFGAGGVRFSVDYDIELVSVIEGLAKKEGFGAGTLGERDSSLDHGTMVPLFFLQKYIREVPFVRVSLSGLPYSDHYRMGQLIAEAADCLGRRVYFVGSGDLSHRLRSDGPYGFAPEGPLYDQRIMDVCSRAAFGELFDFEESFCEKAGECGHRSFVMLSGALDGLDVQARCLSHQDVTGVGYGVCLFTPGERNEKRRFLKAYLSQLSMRLKQERESSDVYVKLARYAIDSFVLARRRIGLGGDSFPGAGREPLPEELRKERAGVFVSIEKKGMLRGCIGSIAPGKSCIGEEIIDMAIKAATQDPRFPEIEPEELPWLEIHVDVLGTPEPISSLLELDVKRYGVIVSRGSRKGVLLPDLEGVDSPRQQVAIAMQKAGIGPEEEVHLYRFEVVRHV